MSCHAPPIRLCNVFRRTCHCCNFQCDATALCNPAVMHPLASEWTGQLARSVQHPAVPLEWKCRSCEYLLPAQCCNCAAAAVLHLIARRVEWGMLLCMTPTAKRASKVGSLLTGTRTSLEDRAAEVCWGCELSTSGGVAGILQSIVGQEVWRWPAYRVLHCMALLCVLNTNNNYLPACALSSSRSAAAGLIGD